MGRPGVPIRLLVGLHYLKHAFIESDESVVARFVENPYWQHFCGFEFFQHRLPLDPTTLVKWRKRIGSKGMEKLLQSTIVTAVRREHLTPQSLERVNVDTTVQEKAIAYPTDARLYHKARMALVKLAKERGIALRQSYERLGKKAYIKHGRYKHARQMNRAKRELKRLKIYLGRIIRDIARKVATPDQALATLLERSSRIFDQKQPDKNKLYSLHAPEVSTLPEPVNSSPPRNAFKSAILANAAAVILAHNHPSGDTTPSREDKEITKRLREAGDILGIKVLDHVIVDTDSGISFSFVESGLL